MSSISPLFAVQAEQLIRSGNPSEAIEICLRGIDTYSDYPAAYAVAARAYIAIENQIEAIKILEKGLMLFPLHKTLKLIYNEILHPIEKNEVLELEAKLENNRELLQFEEQEELQTKEKRFSPLRIIETVKVPSNYIGSLKAASINIISGLEYATLKIENGNSSQYSAMIVSEPPPFPTFLRKPKPSIEDRNFVSNDEKNEHLEHTKLTPLEELAARLEKVRIPVAYQEIARSNNPSQVVPEMITETMARIYEKQGAFSEAVKAYQILARKAPDKLEFYENKINEIMKLIQQEQNELSEEQSQNED